jgi:hypothetical protein
MIANEVRDLPAARRVVAMHSEHGDAGGKPRLATSLLALALFWGLALAGQRVCGAYGTELSGESDEAAHFVTSLMVHDWVADAFTKPGALLHPVHLAKEFYLHYPKVAIGHWPPVFYLLAAAWMLVFPATSDSILVLSALISAVLALTLFRVVLREFGSQIAALISAVLLLGFPAVVRATSLVMLDVNIAVFAFGAAVVWGRFLDSGRWKYGWWFSVLTALGALTKGNGYLLVMLPLITIPAARRYDLLRKKAFWMPAVVGAVPCLIWSFATVNLVVPSMQGAFGLPFTIAALRFYSLGLPEMTGWMVFGLAGLGFVVRFVPPVAAVRPSGLWYSLAALIAADVVFHSIAPAGFERRYLIVAAPALLLFALSGGDWLCRKVPFLPGRRAVKAGLLFAAVIFAAAFSFKAAPKYSFGFSEAARDILADPTLKNSVLLVSSDGDGEGILVSEIAMHETRNGHYVLRASKVLAESDWNGIVYRLKYQTPDRIDEFLDSVPVDVVVIDERALGSRFPHGGLLRAAMNRAGWSLMGIYPKNRAGAAPDARVEVFRRVTPSGRLFDPSRLNFSDFVKQVR